MHCIFNHFNVFIVTMTNWLPDIRRTGAPIYIEIADAMAHDIDTGTLKPGEKLPPQRNLAFDIGVTIGTIGRAYALARQRGLVTGEVGRGTYVRSSEPLLSASAAATSGPRHVAEEPVPDGIHPAPGKLRLDSTSAPEVGQSGLITRHVAAIMADYPDKTTDYIRSLKPEWQQAGQAWLSTGGWQADAASIVPTLGVHAGMMAAIATLTAPGDKVAFEAVTYASLARAVNLTGRRPVSVPDDCGRYRCRCLRSSVRQPASESGGGHPHHPEPDHGDYARCHPRAACHRRAQTRCVDHRRQYLRRMRGRGPCPRSRFGAGYHVPPGRTVKGGCRRHQVWLGILPARLCQVIAGSPQDAYRRHALHAGRNGSSHCPFRRSQYHCPRLSSARTCPA